MPNRQKPTGCDPYCVSFPRAFLFAVILIPLVCPRACRAAAPYYKSLGRQQRREYTPQGEDLMRIWIVYVGQGDGILIQLPPRCNYDPDPTDSDHDRTETVDIMIDGGSHHAGNATRMESFLLDLYDDPLIEHAVISHHDADHVKGLIHILNSDSVTVEAIYHNGVASYRRGVRNFSDDTTSSEAIRVVKNGHLIRGMAFIDNENRFREEDLVDSKDQLHERFENQEFEGIYNQLARAVLEKEYPAPVETFQRSRAGAPFINERETQLQRNTDIQDVRLTVIWPLDRPRKYKQWSETINGNSVTFRLDYGAFSMLFTGDHNELSEEKLIEHLEQQEQRQLLDVDVLKVPHHGSSHARESFFRRKNENGQTIRPVMAVASMGPQGFGTSLKHPSTDVIRWLGGAHRVYHTFIHEKRFKWSNMQQKSERQKMHEISHILVETDGRWFRIVEIDADDGDINSPRTVKQTTRGDGTQWISAN